VTDGPSIHSKDGRGACDMKGGLAASIIAAEKFIEVYGDYKGSIEISGTADEESGGFGGVAYLAEHGWFDPDRVQHVIIPEPLNKDRICLGHRGVLWTEIETYGHIAHGSMPFQGECAIRHMGAVVEAIEQKIYPSLQKKTTAMPVVPEQARQSTLNINSILPDCPPHWYPTDAAWCSIVASSLKKTLKMSDKSCRHCYVR